MNAAVKGLLAAGCSLALMFGVVGCGSNSNEAKDSSSTATSESQSTNSSAQAEYQKFLDIKLGMTEDEVDAILGEPTEVTDDYHIYTMDVDGTDAEIKIMFDKDGKVTSKNADIASSEYKEAFGDSNVNFTDAQKINDKEVTTYNEFVQLLGTDGMLYSENDNGYTSYFWLNNDGGIVRATFDSDGDMTIANGVY